MPTLCCAFNMVVDGDQAIYELATNTAAEKARCKRKRRDSANLNPDMGVIDAYEARKMIRKRLAEQIQQTINQMSKVKQGPTRAKTDHAKRWQPVLANLGTGARLFRYREDNSR